MCSAKSWSLCLVCWGLLWPHTLLSNAAVYYVMPYSPNPDCPSEEPCLAINEYAQGNQFDGDDNITLLLLNGEHNFTAQNFTIHNKTALKMAPSHVWTPLVVINLYSSGLRTGVLVQFVNEIEIFDQEFRAPKRTYSEYCSATCLSLSQVGSISLARVSTDSCQFHLDGRMNAIISELSASWSYVYLDSNLSISITNSKLYFSTLNISENVMTARYNGGDNTRVAGFLNLKNSSIRNSFITVELHLQTVYRLSALNTEIASLGVTKSMVTGINLVTFNTVALHAHIKNCRIFGNYQGINLVKVM